MLLPAVVICCLTNLGNVAPGPGLPDDWILRRVRGVDPPGFSVTQEGALRLESEGAAGFAFYEISKGIRPRAGILSWKWRSWTPLPDARLEDRDRDDSPVRVAVLFQDRRVLFYTWGNEEPRGHSFESWTGSSRFVIVLRSSSDADGDWYTEQRDPFEDYRQAFERDPPYILAVGIVQDTDQLGSEAMAEVMELDWSEGNR
jgi:hypothetical protein